MTQAPWVVDEVKTAELEDRRLNRRLGEVLNQLAAHPHASIPAACGGYAETAAAYRFFDNERVTFDKVLAPHQDATRLRIAAQPKVILAQDTTEIDLTRPEQAVVGAGPLDNGPRRGVFLHPLVAFTPDGTPLGTVAATVWTRQDDAPKSSVQTRAERAATPIEAKESYRWVETLRQARQEAQRVPATEVIAVADSEADIFEVLAEASGEGPNFHWIVRGCQNRAVKQTIAHTGANAAEDAANAAGYVREQVLAGPVLFTQSVKVRGRKAKIGCEKRGRRQSRESRTATVEVRAARVVLRPPWRDDRKLPAVAVNVVLVTEIDPPANEPPVDWLLLTDLPIADAQEVRSVIATYCVRWMVEVFFRTLKSGCRVEKRLFEHLDHLLPCLAVYLIVTWRTLYVCRLGRDCPDVSCEAVFEPAEWKGVYYVVHQAPPPAKPPTLAEMVRLVAQLGGYINRKRNDPPGPQTVFLGLQRTHDIATCWLTFGPDAKYKDPDV